MRKYIATALLPLLLAMSACGAVEESPNDAERHGPEITLSDGTEDYMPVVRPDSAMEIEVVGDNVYVYTVTINDKTCFITGYKGGIWCDNDPITEVPDGFE